MKEDLDLQCCAFDGVGLVIDACFYNNPVAAEGGLVLESGDCIDGSERPEVIRIDTAKLPPFCSAVVCGIYNPSGRALSAPPAYDAYWRDQAKAGTPADARIINTTSASGLYGNPGQSNYAAAKAGIASFTVTVALELGRYSVTVNAVAPAARTRLTEALISDDSFPPERVASLVAWLASPESRDITGRVFDIGGDWLSVAQGWRKGPVARQADGWVAGQIGETLRDLLAKAAPNASMFGTVEDLADVR